MFSFSHSVAFRGANFPSAKDKEAKGFQPQSMTMALIQITLLLMHQTVAILLLMPCLRKEQAV